MVTKEVHNNGRLPWLREVTCHTTWASVPRCQTISHSFSSQMTIIDQHADKSIKCDITIK